jgi:5-methylcytosine-specific restriction endonuclease McrA
MDAGLPREFKLNRSEWAAARKRAIQSLDPTCAICHRYIDVTLPKKDPATGIWNDLAVEVDHIVPRSRGGAMYAVENLQLTHSRCNRQKGARMDSDYPEGEVTNYFPQSNAW